jgi:CBS domain containing-hemolysin-like protein
LVFERTEHDIVTRALRLDDQRLGALMTPRTDVEVISRKRCRENMLKIADSPFSRFPVCRGKRSNIVGLVHAGDLVTGSKSWTWTGSELIDGLSRRQRIQWCRQSKRSQTIS